jgi:hypothetical protein
MAIRIDTAQYEASHGRKPRGYGLWIFEIGGRTFQHTGRYSEAQEMARRYAATVLKDRNAIIKVGA